MVLTLLVAGSASASEPGYQVFELPPSPILSLSEPEWGTPEVQRSGKTLVVVTSVVQIVGLGLGIGDAISGGGLAPARIPYSFVSIPFAPLSVLGYQLLLSDGSEGSYLRATGTGLLVGSLHSGLQAGFSGLSIAVGEATCAAAWASWDGEGYQPCFEDVSGIFQSAILVPHAIASLSLLIPGIVMSAAAASRTARSGSANLPILSPAIYRGGGGLQLFGTF